jgi:exodeoxyribonuclease V alpha subunit
MRFLVEHSVSTGLAERIFERYGTHSVEVLKHDPYLLAREMRGIGFLTADRIALNLGLKRDAPQRLKAGIYHALERSADDGHCYLEKPKLFEAACQLLELDPETDLNLYLEGLITEGYIVKECRFAGREALYLKHLERAEVFVAEFVAKRIEPWDERPISEHDVVTCTQRTEAEMGIKFSAEQRHAIECAASQRFLIITGGPGCGKTTVTRAIASLFFRAKKRLLLAAPTGRAAQRLAQVCDKPASTIHRLLRYDPHQGAFRHGINDPLICDGLIVDEASMLDIELAKHLFSAVPAGATLILVGDKDQLPSVGPGRVFGDLVSVSKATTISLSQLFRRSEQSHITAYAHMINAGVVPPIPEPDGRTKTDAYFISRVDPDQAASMLEKLVAEQIPKKFGFKPEEITVLTPSNRGVLGTIALNQRLQARLNPKDKLDSEQEITLGDLTLRVGDRVCQRVNNYQIDEAGVFNGDVGEIYNIDPRHKRIIVELWDGRLIKYEESDISQLSLAYAVTVHRAQGSEMPCVVLALHESHYTLLERQLLYTAVTRAKKLLVIVGSRRALMLAAKRMNAKKRCTLLKDRIEALFTH